MRQLIEIASQLDEYQKITFYDPGDPEAINLEKLTVVDRLNTNLGWLQIAERDDPPYYSVVAIKDGKVVAALDFQRFGGGQYAMLERASAFVQRHGLATSLFKWVHRTYSWKVISDTSMTDVGESFWFSLMRQFGGKVINLETGDIFPLSSIDGQKVIDPKHDDWKPYTIAKEPDGQKWFYLIEEFSTKEIKTSIGTIKPKKYIKGYALNHSLPMSYCEGVLGSGYN